MVSPRSLSSSSGPASARRSCRLSLGDVTGGGGHDPERSQDPTRDEPAEQHGCPDHDDEDDARTDEELAGVEAYW